MSLSFERIQNANQIQLLADMAHEIWNEYWPPRIGQAQTDYMVDLMLSPDALTCDMEQHGYRYWFVKDESGAPLGFTGGALEELSVQGLRDNRDNHARRSAYVDEHWPRRWFISKVYLYAEQRGKHYASRIVEFYEQLCCEEGIAAMYLTVNRGNVQAIRAYEALGFHTVEDVDTDIGQGFIMNDHIMVREVTRPVSA